MSEQIKKGIGFWTANSKKITIALLFFISVLIDKIFLNDIVYGDNIFTSKVFQSIGVVLGIITVKDIQEIINIFARK